VHSFGKNVPLVPKYADLRTAQGPEQSRLFHKSVSVFSVLMSFLFVDLLFIVALQKKILRRQPQSTAPRARMSERQNRHAKSFFRLDLLDESRRH
jgi:hypothetical protein